MAIMTFKRWDNAPSKTQNIIFETGEIIILDRPPVAPYVDVLPYRAVNNRIKIILAGSTDRYRDEPVYILDSDADSFARILSAQPILDGKVEFGSDDPIDSFQIFRIQTKPKSYSDFKLNPWEMVRTEFLNAMTRDRRERDIAISKSLMWFDVTPRTTDWLI